MDQDRARLTVIVIACAVIAVAAGCATQPVDHPDEAPGFFMGLLHGFLIIFSFIGSLFTDVRIYAFPNSGGWYDLGFLLGASGSLGGSAAATARG